ncbi:hypothetical protein ACSW9O_15315 (plasmid) [Clostridium perfringens]
MDKFKEKNTREATAMDFYDTNIVVQNTKLRAKDKKMLHKLSRSRIKQETNKEVKVYTLKGNRTKEGFLECAKKVMEENKGFIKSFDNK